MLLEYPYPSLLLGVITLLAPGKAPPSISKYLAEDNLTAMKKGTPDPLDVKLIVVGEMLRCVTNKCHTEKCRAFFFSAFQCGAACLGSEKNCTWPSSDH